MSSANNLCIEHKRMTQIGNTSSVLKTGAWTAEEDIRLKNDIQKFGEGKWHLVPLRAGLNRCRKSCRLRWLNYLKPDIKRGAFQEDEIDLMHRLHKLLGNRWSLIAGRIPGRTANDIKNYWNTHVQPRTKRRKLNLKEGESSQQHEAVRVIKPKAHILSKTLNMYHHIAPHDKGKHIISSNDGFNISPPLVSPPAASDDQILDKLFENYEKEMNDGIGWSLGGVTVEGGGLDIVHQEDIGGNNLFNFPIDDVFSNLLD